MAEHRKGFTPRALHEAASPPSSACPAENKHASPQPPVCCSAICVIDAGRATRTVGRFDQSVDPSLRTDVCCIACSAFQTLLPLREASACVRIRLRIEAARAPCRLIVGDLTVVATPFDTPATHLPARPFASPSAIVLPGIVHVCHCGGCLSTAVVGTQCCRCR